MRMTIAVGLALALCCNKQSNSTDQGAWAANEEQAFARARAEGKGVLVEFMADWCVPCAELDRALHAEPVLRAVYASFVPVKIDVSQGDDQAEAVSQRYGRTTMPCIVFVSRTHEVVGRITASSSETELGASVTAAATRLGAAR